MSLITAGAISLLATASSLATARLPPLAAAAAAYDRAQVDGDARALERLLADDYRLVNGAGEVETKIQFITESTAPGFKLDPYVVGKPVVTIWRGGAVLAGEVMLGGVSDDRRFAAHIRFADVWAMRRGR